MENLQLKLISDSMLKQCRKLVPVTRRMNEADDAAVMDCFQKYFFCLDLAGQALEEKDNKRSKASPSKIQRAKSKPRVI